MVDIEKIRSLAENIFAVSKGSHGWDHTLRVYNLAIHIGKNEGADLDVLKVAALLHDIARHEQDVSKGKICHAAKGAEDARIILSDLDLSRTFIDSVCHCIETHRFRGSNIPISKEAKILFDADKLDSIGAVGIGRAFLFSGEVGARLHHQELDISKTEIYGAEDTAYREYLVKLRKVKDKITTSEGKRIAQSRDIFMKEFFDRLNSEFKGEL